MVCCISCICGGCAVVFIAWALFIVSFFRKLIKKDLKYTEKLNPNIDELHKPFERYDRQNWCLLEIYLCAIFLLPTRIFFFLSSLIFLWVFHFLVGTNKIKNIQLEFPPWRRILTNIVSRLVARVLLYSIGIYYINIHKRKIRDYDPSYPYSEEEQSKIKAPIIISNHISTIETIMMSYLYFPSFLSKKEVANYPLFGVGTKGLQSIFVDRENQQNKDSVVNDIKFRAEQILAGKHLSPIIIFPEGTTSNGRYLLSFKKGAFENYYPVKIVCVKFAERHFNPTLDSIPVHLHTLILLSQWCNKVDVYELGTYDPAFLNLKNPDDWQIFADKTKQIMLKCLNAKDSQAGYRNMKEYEALLKQQAKQEREAAKQKKQQPQQDNPANNKSENSSEKEKKN